MMAVQSFASPNKVTMAKVMQASLKDAGLNADQINYISGHGTATVHGDIAESVATHEVMSNAIPFSTLKGYIGHSLARVVRLKLG